MRPLNDAPSPAPAVALPTKNSVSDPVPIEARSRPTPTVTAAIPDAAMRPGGWPRIRSGDAAPAPQSTATVAPFSNPLLTPKEAALLRAGLELEQAAREAAPCGLGDLHARHHGSEEAGHRARRLWDEEHRHCAQAEQPTQKSEGPDLRPIRHPEQGPGHEGARGEPGQGRDAGQQAAERFSGCGRRFDHRGGQRAVDHSHGQPLDDPGGEQSTDAVRRQEESHRRDLDGQRRDDHRLAAQVIGQGAGNQQRDHEHQRVDAEGHRQHARGEPPPSLEDDEEGRRHAGRDEEQKQDGREQREGDPRTTDRFER